MPFPVNPNPSTPKGSVGQVLLVGAGPGDPGLLTLRGRGALESADLVLYDYLASEALLVHTPPHAEKICLGRHGQGKIWTQQEINDRMTAEALAGKRVVRLKGGDPSIFARLAEETAACRAAGVPYEIVPGVTTAVAASAYAGMAITDRQSASCVAFVTGHECAGKASHEALDFARLARFPGTLVVYMGVTTAPQWSKRLIDGGKPSDTPVLLVRKCSLSDQSCLGCTLGELPKVIEESRVRPPLVAFVGEVARRDAAADWFTSRPLFGKTVLVTRPRSQAASMTERLSELGARVLLQPTIEIGPPEDWAGVDEAIDRLGVYDVVAFSSRNGVEAFMRRLEVQGADPRRFAGARIAVVGSSTAAALAEWRLHADYQPSEHNAEALADLLMGDAAGKRFLLVRGDRGRGVLAESLTGAGGEVEQVVVYQSTDTDTADAAVLEELSAGRVDWVTATSPAIARSAVRLFGECWGEARLAAISPLTADTLAGLGRGADAVAEEYTTEGLINAILRAESIA